MSKLVHSTDEAIERLKQGQIGIFPTDTAYGIGCRMDDIKSVKKVYEIRNRPSEKALIVLVGSFEMAKEYVKIGPNSLKIIEKYWPGGVSIIFDCFEEKVPEIVRAKGKTLAVRLPDHVILREIIQSVGVPIVAPSANIAGYPTPYTVSDISEDIKKDVDFILSGVCTMKGVSTIVDTTVLPIEIVRQGVVNIDD